jgi:hypothetical protein
LKIKTKIFSSFTADSKPVKQEVNGTVILPPLLFPAWGNLRALACHPTKKVNKAEEQTYLSTKIGINCGLKKFP